MNCITTIDPLTLLVKYNLIDQQNGTIYDTRTKLFWQQEPPDNSYAWEEAHKYCESLTLAGHKDWRLPTIKELKTLIVMEYRPTICPIFKCPIFKCKDSWYWSSSSYVGCTALAWLVYFYYGYVHYDGKDFRHYVRAVRG